MRSDQRLFDTPQPETYRCLGCGVSVGAERHAELADPEKVTPPGRARIAHDGALWEIWFTPESRYWSMSGVFCGPKCSLAFVKRKKP